tara:strand:+ start:10347 stop:11783 length:1437 start_codon:yes stop_codon:yes gene_type:complete
MILYLTGAEHKNLANALIFAKCKHASVNYFYLKNRSTAKLKEHLDMLKEAGMSLLLDSGAYNYETSLESYDIESYRKYYKKYLDFIYKYHEYFNIVSEPDFTTDEGLKCVREYRHEMKKYKSIITHPENTFTEEAIIKPDYAVDFYCIGLKGSLNKSDYNRLMSSFSGGFKKNSTKFHGWGIGSPAVLNSVNFYSVTTSTWTSGSRYKACFLYKTGKKIRRLYDSHSTLNVRRKHKNAIKRELEKLNIDVEQFNKDNFDALNKWNAVQWVGLQQGLDKQSTEVKRVKLVDPPDTSLVKSDDSSKLSIANDPRIGIGRYCDTCTINDICPLYLKESDCRLEYTADISGPGGLQAAAERLLSLQMSRVEHGLVVEKLTGQVGTEELDNQVDRATKLLQTYKKITEAPKSGIRLEAEGAGVGALTMLLSNIGRGSYAGDGKTQNYSARRSSQLNTEKAVKESEKETDDIIDAEFEENNNDS